MNTQNIKEGQIFPTKTKLIKAMGEIPKKDSSKDAQWKDIECLIAWEYTGKLNKNTKKVSGEIRITKIYDIPLVKEDKRKLKKGEFTDCFDLLIPRIETGRYKTSEMFEHIFGNTFEDKYIEHWKFTRIEDKNIKELTSKIKDKFTSNLMTNLERFDRNNDGFIYSKVYHLWNAEFFKNGMDIYEFEFKPFREECIEKFKEINNLNKIYRGNEKFDKYFSECLIEKFGYECHCVMYEITNNLEVETVSGTRIRNARIELRNKIIKSVSKNMNDYNYQMKNAMRKKTGEIYYPYRNDIRIFKMVNRITEDYNFARTYFDITNESIISELAIAEEELKLKLELKQKELDRQNESKAIVREINKKNMDNKISYEDYDPDYPF